MLDQFILLEKGCNIFLLKANSPGIFCNVVLTVALIAYWAAIHLLWTNEDLSSNLLGGFSLRLMTTIVLIDWCILSTIAFDWGFLTVVGTYLILFFLNMFENAGPRNSFPLSCIHFDGAGYWLSQLFSEAWATTDEVAFSTGITSGKPIIESIQVRALNSYSNWLMLTLHGPIISTRTSSQGSTAARINFGKMYIFLESF